MRVSQVPKYFDDIVESFDVNRSHRFVHLGYWPDGSPAMRSGSEFEVAQARLNEFVVGRAALESGDRVLDVGCGLGGTLAYLNEHLDDMRLVGVNIDERQLQLCRTLKARGSNRLQWQLADACQLPFPDNSFDCVLSIEAMFHFTSRRQFFSEVFRVLKPQGRFVATDMVIEKSLTDLQVPGFLFEAILSDGYGPWPEFWAASQCHALIAEQVGLEELEWLDISSQTVASHEFTVPQNASEQFDTGQKAVRAAMALRWLHQQGHLKYVAMTFCKRD